MSYELSDGGCPSVCLNAIGAIAESGRLASPSVPGLFIVSPLLRPLSWNRGFIASDNVPGLSAVNHVLKSNKYLLLNEVEARNAPSVVVGKNLYLP